jgi:16S rRNA (adenine1518-N6/adenine1519-N6)-dimethyltransferase
LPPDLSIQPRPRGKSLLTQTRQLLRQAGLRARKGLGQHFLVDGGVLKHILSAAELSPNDIVIEVGPGLGVLSRELARQAGWVVAVELDDNLASLLKETLAPFSNVTIVNRDILKVDPQALLHAHFPDRKGVLPTEGWHYKVVANLPYYITSPVLRHFLEASLKPQTMVVMVQKEVARQITAQPGRLSLLGISIQLYGEPKIVKYVRASSFYPAPEVDSAILRIVVYPRPVVEVDTESFFTMVRAGFSAARKQLCNSLAQGLNRPKAEALSLLEKSGIDSRRRAETLSLEEWARLWRVYAQTKEIT